MLKQLARRSKLPAIAAGASVLAACAASDEMTAFELPSDEVIETVYATTSRLYAEHCAVCHGDQLQGAAQGSALVGGELVHGDSPEALIAD